MNITLSPVPPVSVPVVSSKDAWPEWVTSRWGEWHMDRQTGATMISRFGEDISRDGDPRHLMAHRFETSAIALRHGRLGVHSEIELDITEGDDAEDSTVLSSAAFARAIGTWQSRLAPLVDAFPKSEVFLAHGITYDGRLTLNAFTPLQEDGEHFRSPYAEADRIEALDTALNELLLGPSQQ